MSVFPFLFCCQVRLLLGEVPDRAEFSVPGLSRPLRPYFELTQAVRSGDLVAFAQVRSTGLGAGSGGRVAVVVWLLLGCKGLARKGRLWACVYVLTVLWHALMEHP